MDDQRLIGRIGWVAPLGLSLVVWMLAGVFWLLPGPRDLLTFIAGCLSVMALVEWLVPALRKRDKYSLTALRDLDEREELDRIDVGDVSPDPERIICPQCGRARKNRLPICPDCGHS